MVMRKIRTWLSRPETKEEIVEVIEDIGPPPTVGDLKAALSRLHPESILMTHKRDRGYPYDLVPNAANHLNVFEVNSVRYAVEGDFEYLEGEKNVVALTVAPMIGVAITHQSHSEEDDYGKLAKVGRLITHLERHADHLILTPNPKGIPPLPAKTISVIEEPTTCLIEKGEAGYVKGHSNRRADHPRIFLTIS
jgi:hypothetical protein